MEFNPVVIGLHIVIYVGVIFVLKHLYFNPVLAILKRREALTEGRQESTAQLKEDISRLKGLYFTQVDALKSELYEKKQKVVVGLQDEAQKTFEAAKKENEKECGAYQSKIDTQLEQVRQTLPDVGSRLGDEIVESVTNSRVVRF